jgi:hypothetical protein
MINNRKNKLKDINTKVNIKKKQGPEKGAILNILTKNVWLTVKYQIQYKLAQLTNKNSAENPSKFQDFNLMIKENEGISNGKVLLNIK